MIHPVSRGIRYRVTHTTRYFYSQAVPLCHNEIHLMPRSGERQSCLSHRLLIDPQPHKIEECLDFFGNHVQFFMVGEAHKELSVSAQSQVRVIPVEPPRVDHTPAWETVRDQLARPSDAQAFHAAQFLYDSPHIGVSDALAELAAPSFQPGTPWLEGMLDLTARIFDEFVYDPTATNVSTPLNTVLELRRGVCQDFAHLQIGCLRSLGLPARYVSGYLLTTPPPGKPRLVGADASHAWLAAYCPSVGWVEFDPTNNLMPSLDHITVSWGRDYSDVCPIRGVFVGGGEHSMQVSVDVLPLDDPKAV